MISNKIIRLAVNDYRRGASLPEVAQHFNLTLYSARRLLEQGGAEMRRRGSRGRVDVKTEQIIALREKEGLTWEQIGRKVDMTGSGVRHRYYTAKANDNG